MLGLSVMLASNNIFSQAEVSHGASQPLEISVSGRGGPVVVNPGEKKLISFFPKSGTVSTQVRFLNKRNRYETLSVPIHVYDGKAFIPSPPDISNRVIESKKSESSSVGTTTTTQTTDSGDGYSPAVGKVNQIKNITSDIPAFNIKLKNEAKSMGDLIFVGSVFTGVAISPTGEIITSKEKVRPGLIEFTVLYRMPYGPTGSVKGQQFALAQQALAFIVTDPEEVLVIKDEYFFNFADLAPNTKVRFKNVGSTTMYAKSAVKKLQRPLRRGRTTAPISLEDAYSTMWYYKDKDNVDRLCVYQSMGPGRGNQFYIRIVDSDYLYNVGQ